MKQIQITVPKNHKEKVNKVLKDYSNDISTSKTQKNDKESIEFKLTVQSSDIDEITDKLKSIKEIKTGELFINVLEQQSLIEKGQKTKGSISTLSQNEIYSKAQQFGGFTNTQWGLVALSAGIASLGLALDNLIIVIGAMMFSPLLSPFVATAISLTVGDKTLMKQGFTTGTISTIATILISFLIVLPIPITTNPTLELVSTPGIIPIIVSLLVGSAAALTFASGLRDQVAGVAVAIALVPPLAAVGIAIKMTDIVFLLEAGSVAIINILSIIVSGYFTFSILGLKPDTYYKKKDAEEIKNVVKAAFILIIILSLAIGYASHQSYQNYIFEQEIQQQAQQHFQEDIIATNIQNNNVRIVVTGQHNTSEFKENLPRDYEIEIIELQTHENG